MPKYHIAPSPVYAQFFYNINPVATFGEGQQIPTGFSEGHWLNFTSQAAADQDVVLYNNARLALCAPDVSLVAIRVINTMVLRRPYLVDITRTATPICQNVGTFSKTGQTAAQKSLDPQLAALHRLTTANLAYSFMFLHALPAALYDPEEGLKMDDPDWAPLYATWKSKLLGSQTPPGNSAMQLVGKDLTAQNITSVNYIGLRARKVGRPFGLFHGSRPVR